MALVFRYREQLEVLLRHQVDFLVIGGVGANLAGAAATTFDLDVVHSRRLENIPKLLSALAELEALHRGDSRGLKPNESHLISPGHQLLQTKHGRLDLMGAVDSLTYEDLIGDTEIAVIDDLRIPTLKLEKIIWLKERAGRPKDLAVLPLLRATLAEKQRLGK